MTLAITISHFAILLMLLTKELRMYINITTHRSISIRELGEKNLAYYAVQNMQLKCAKGLINLE